MLVKPGKPQTRKLIKGRPLVKLTLHVSNIKVPLALEVSKLRQKSPTVLLQHAYPRDISGLLMASYDELRSTRFEPPCEFTIQDAPNPGISRDEHDRLMRCVENARIEQQDFTLALMELGLEFRTTTLVDLSLWTGSFRRLSSNTLKLPVFMEKARIGALCWIVQRTSEPLVPKYSIAMFSAKTDGIEEFTDLRKLLAALAEHEVVAHAGELCLAEKGILEGHVRARILELEQGPDTRGLSI